MNYTTSVPNKQTNKEQRRETQIQTFRRQRKLIEKRKYQVCISFSHTLKHTNPHEQHQRGPSNNRAHRIRIPKENQSDKKKEGNFRRNRIGSLYHLTFVEFLRGEHTRPPREKKRNDQFPCPHTIRNIRSIPTTNLIITMKPQRFNCERHTTIAPPSMTLLMILCILFISTGKSMCATHTRPPMFMQ